jgi:hypothetical protein
MITRKRARELVSNQVCGPYGQMPEGDEIIILDEATIEKPWGWVFFYTSKKWHETKDFKYAIAGHSPIIVERTTGKLFITGTAYPIQHYIQNYEQSGDPHTPRDSSPHPEVSETVWQFLDTEAIPATVNPPDEESRVIPIGWILLWTIIIALIVFFVWRIF